MFIEYMELAKKYEVKRSFIKQHAMYFTRGVEGSARLRNEMTKLDDADKILELFKDFVLEKNN